MSRQAFIFLSGTLLSLLHSAYAAAEETIYELQSLSEAHRALVGKTLISPEDAWSLARDVVYRDQEQTLYCGCPWVPYDKFDGAVAPSWCGLNSDGADDTSEILSWDNVVPASWFGRGLSCWKEGHEACHRGGVEYRGQACCALLDTTYMEMSVDLHNIVPAVLSINQSKANYPTGIVRGEPREFGQCNFEVGDIPSRYEPAISIRGDVARTWLYMDDTYGMALSASYRTLLERWAEQDPVDGWELERAKRVTALQGRFNPYIQMQGAIQ